MWVQDLGMFERSEVESLEKVGVEKARERCEEGKGKMGRTRYLPTRVGYEKMRPLLRKVLSLWELLHWLGKSCSVKSCVFKGINASLGVNSDFRNNYHERIEHGNESFYTA